MTDPARIKRKLRRKIVVGLTRLLGTGVRESDIFVVGYPKSGTTWMEFLLIHALLEKKHPDRVNFRTQHGYVPDLSGLGPADRVFLWPYAARRDPRVFFTHCPFNRDLANAHILYVLRDPRDVLVSYWYHQRRTATGGGSLSAFVRAAHFYPCHWDRHVAGWLDAAVKLPHFHLVRYEDLRRDTAGVLTQILAFTGAAYSPADVERAVKMASFERMRALEQRYPAPDSRPDSGIAFVRRGTVGGWKDELSADDLRFILARYGPTMRRVGYLSDQAVALART